MLIRQKALKERLILVTYLIAGFLVTSFIFIQELPVEATSNQILDKMHAVVTTNGIHLGYCAYDSINDEAVRWYAEHAGLLIISEWQKDKVEAIKRLNPDIIFLLYKISINKSSSTHGAYGYDWVDRKHSEWFLLDKNGQRMTDQYDEHSKKNVYWMDWGNQDWRKYWCDSVLKDVIMQDWDGVFMDCAFVNISGRLAPNGVLQYKDNKSFNKAMEGFLAYCYEEFQKAGKLFIPNSCECVKYDGYWEDRLNRTDGGLDEGFVNIYRWGPKDIWRSVEQWERQISYLEHTGEKDKIFLAMAHNRGLNRQDLLYNVASFLLAKKGTKDFFYNGGISGYRFENYIKDYNIFKDIYSAPIGHPLADRYKAQGVWQRNYSNGKVLVNPTSNTYTVRLEKAHKQLDGTVVSSVKLDGHTGIILLGPD